MKYLEQPFQIFQDLGIWFNSPFQVMYWGYLLSTLLIAMLMYFLRDRQSTKSVFKVFSYCFPSNIYFTRSFLQDMGFYLINLVLFAFILTSISIAAESLGSQIYYGLQHYFGSFNPPFVGEGASIIYMFTVMLAMDFGFFISHYLHHKIPLLWEFHKVHHTASVLNPLTAFRRHPVDYFIEFNIIAVLLGLVYGVFAWMSNDTLDMLSILGVNAGVFLFLMIGSHLQHSHIWISYGFLNKLFVSPAMHQIHHSSAAEHLDKNMGSMFSFWDWIIGTRYIPKQRQPLHLGLAGTDSGSSSDGCPKKSFWGMLLQPFIKLVHRLLYRLR